MLCPQNLLQLLSYAVLVDEYTSHRLKISKLANLCMFVGIGKLWVEISKTQNLGQFSRLRSNTFHSGGFVCLQIEGKNLYTIMQNNWLIQAMPTNLPQKLD